MRLIIAGGSRTLVAAATASTVTATRPAATRELDNLSCRRQYHTHEVRRRRRTAGREYSTASVCMSPSPQHHDPNTSFAQGAPPPLPPPPISQLSSSYVRGAPKELDGVDVPLPTTASSQQLRNSNLPLTPSQDIKQQEQDQEQVSASTRESSQVPPSASDPAVPATATAAAAGAAAATNNTTTAQPSSSSSTTSRSLKQIIQASPIGRAADFYSRMQSRRPYWTQLWCTLLIYLCGDLSAQLFVGDGGGKDKDKTKEKVEKEGKGGANDEVEREEGMMARYDPLRTVRHLTVGGLAAVPGYKWFMFLHNNFNFPSKPRIFSIFIKVAINQTCFTPIFNTYFFSMQSLLAGTSLTETWERLKLALPTSIMNSAKLWPAVTAFMFMYVDPQFRSIFAGAIAVGWQTYLSWLNQKAARDVEAAEEAQAQTLAVKRLIGGGVGVGDATATAAVAAVSA
ncbi:hypothetical protein RJZ56_003270 [Blastomyces dermatitidis]|uniref:Integral membrane protein n=2 Tax=Ajellomyces dermatitidis TaxID=5039 RepID=F2T9Y7_AJEDA|nr:uncharacterized protein BDCG_01026 [Blastomyces dermatitidis ER-3]EEQ84221.1 integral membrane protein [Blastomyces dermatitidis ER-3]EGE80050.1 integral membrane protein [Blastomyces dermatitidis ATCC 18188]